MELLPIPVAVTVIALTSSSLPRTAYKEAGRQAEKSARLEAEARCAAALEALRRAGHPEGAPLTLPMPRQLPKSVTDRAREGVTAARSLVASVCTILEGQPKLPV